MFILIEKPAAYVPPALRGKPQSTRAKFVGFIFDEYVIRIRTVYVYTVYIG